MEGLNQDQSPGVEFMSVSGNTDYAAVYFGNNAESQDEIPRGCAPVISKSGKVPLASSTGLSSHTTEVTGNFLKHLECSICTDVLSPPIYICINGHSCCGNCRPKMLRCGFCKANFSRARNYCLETVLNNCSVPCEFQPKGCSQICRLSDFASHRNVCTYNLEVRSAATASNWQPPVHGQIPYRGQGQSRNQIRSQNPVFPVGSLPQDLMRHFGISRNPGRNVVPLHELEQVGAERYQYLSQEIDALFHSINTDFTNQRQRMDDFRSDLYAYISATHPSSGSNHGPAVVPATNAITQNAVPWIVDPVTATGASRSTVVTSMESRSEAIHPVPMVPCCPLGYRAPSAQLDNFRQTDPRVPAQEGRTCGPRRH